MTGPSRTMRRAGTKSLVCNYCPTGKNGKRSMRFRGRPKHRLARHIAEVHSR